MKRIALVTALLGTIVLAFAGVASAYTVNSDGSLYVSKGEVQSAMKWNNGDFDNNAKSVAFAFGSGSQVNHTRVNYTCGTDTWSSESTVSWTRTVTKAQPVLSSNGKQLTGWNLTDSGLTLAGITGYDGLAAIDAANFYNNCTSDVHSISVDQWTDGSTDGLTVNGKALSLTPTL